MPKKRESKADLTEFHRKTAVACFNKAWDFLDKKERSRDEDLQMLHEAHTSRYHWGHVGKAQNFAVGDWQISRVYAALKQPVLALHFAKSSLDTCEKNNLKDQLLSAYEGMARAHATANETEEAKRYLDMARKQLELVKDEEDRKVYGQQIDETEALIKR
jgi:cation transport regulator ChaB